MISLVRSSIAYVGRSIKSFKISSCLKNLKNKISRFCSNMFNQYISLGNKQKGSILDKTRFSLLADEKVPELGDGILDKPTVNIVKSKPKSTEKQPKVYIFKHDDDEPELGVLSRQPVFV